MVSFTKKKIEEYPPMPFDIRGKFEDELFLALTPADLLCEYNAFIFEINDNVTRIAAVSPSEIGLHQYASSFIDGNVEFFSALQDDITTILLNKKTDYLKEINQLINSQFANDDIIPKLVDYIIQFAFAKKASDIHIEPHKTEIVVRFRLDGVLHKVISIPAERHSGVVARFKILADLKTDETRHPQDGRIEPDGFGESTLRISIIPTLYGEKIVLRILDESSTVLSLDNLGFSKDQQEVIKRNVEKPYGMIVASGPTGSGKTTSLYALLHMLDKHTMNIATLEDPIEFALEGINQTQVVPEQKFSFVEGLRSLLRQDPDVILVGEIRDNETVSMAANAAMTGHMVMSTLHTNDAPSAFSRFVEMGVDDYMIGSIVNLVIAQRLVRRVCKKCKSVRKLNKTLVDKLKNRQDILNALSHYYDDPIGGLENTRYAQGRGCEECFHTGYRGRVGIYELLEMNKDIHNQIINRESTEAIRQSAEEKGYKNMLHDGLQKIFDGTTTFEEILRTTRNT